MDDAHVSMVPGIIDRSVCLLCLAHAPRLSTPLGPLLPSSFHLDVQVNRVGCAPDGYDRVTLFQNEKDGGGGGT